MTIEGVHVRDLAKNDALLFKVRGVREFHWRLRFGCWLVRLAALIIWMDCEVSFERKGQNGND